MGCSTWICKDCETYLSKLTNVFVQINKLTNVFAQIAILSDEGRCKSPFNGMLRVASMLHAH